MMAGVATVCEECEGKRFEASVLKYHLGGRDISEVLGDVGDRGRASSSSPARRRRPPPHAILEPPRRRRAWLPQPRPAAHHAVRRRTATAQAGHPHGRERAASYLLDEPTTGLHLADVEQLLGLLDRLVDSGKSVIVIEHHQAVMAHGDWIIDLGPGAGHDGGRIVFEGTPADLVATRTTLTGEHLAAYVGADNGRVDCAPVGVDDGGIRARAAGDR